MKRRAAIAALACGLLPVAAAAAGDVACPPVPAAEIIAPGVVSTPFDEFGGAISPDGRSLYFDRSVPPHYLYTLWVSHDAGGGWGEPELLPFSGRYRDSDPVLSPDGTILLFASDRPVRGVDLHAFHIWAAHLTAAGWGEPVLFDGPVNDAGSQVFASLAANGNLYFSSNRGGTGTYQIYRTRLAGGIYQPAEKLGAAINPEGSYTSDAFIAPDESYLLLATYGAPGGYGSYDITISYNRNGVWSYPVNLGPAVNTPARDYSPRVTPDGKYLIFTSERGFGMQRPEAPLTYDDFERGVHSVFNGLGNLYRIALPPILCATRAQATFPAATNGG